MALETENLAFGVVQSELRPQPDGDTVECPQESCSHHTSYNYV